MPERSVTLVLDTHTWIWWAGGAPLNAEARAAIERAAAHGAVLISAISVWEVAMLVSKGRLVLSMPIGEWCRQALALPGFSLAPLSPDVAIESCQLPGDIHQDPADRMIAATARMLGATLVTRDEKLLAYGAAGHIATLFV
jgi:PIN domain nuclease of toxin-antitoxin system